MDETAKRILADLKAEADRYMAESKQAEEHHCQIWADQARSLAFAYQNAIHVVNRHLAVEAFGERVVA